MPSSNYQQSLPLDHLLGWPLPARHDLHTIPCQSCQLSSMSVAQACGDPMACGDPQLCEGPSACARHHVSVGHLVARLVALARCMDIVCCVACLPQTVGLSSNDGDTYRRCRFGPSTSGPRPPVSPAWRQLQRQL